MISIFKFDLKTALRSINSRQDIHVLAEQALQLLNNHATLEIDLEDINLTPSIADGFIGFLAEKLGLDKFKEKIKIQNVSSSQALLLRHVIARRVTK